MAKIDPNEMCPCGSGKLFKECHEPQILYPVTPDITQEVRLRVIPEPEPGSRSLFVYQGEGTVCFRSYQVGLALCCGRCGAHLVVGLYRGQLQDLVFKCKACGAFNEA